MSDPIFISSEEQRTKAIRMLAEIDLNTQPVTFKKVRNARTIQQNIAIHLFCSQLATELNNSGQEVKKIMALKPEVDIPWSTLSVKELIWKVVQEAVTGKSSTVEANKVEYTDVYEVVNRFTSDRLGISIPFPSEESR